MAGWRWIRTIAVILLATVSACTSPPPNEPPTPPKSFVVFFTRDSAALDPEAVAVIDRIAEEARRIQATGVGISGYSGPAGTPAANLRLSEERSAAVEQALIERGVSRDIIVRTYHGATDVAGPQLEGQRVEVVVTRETRRR